MGPVGPVGPVRPGAARLPCEAPGVRAVRLHVGVGAPLARLPVYAVLDLFVDIEHDRFWWWHGAALTASLLITLAGGCRAVPRYHSAVVSRSDSRVCRLGWWRRMQRC